MRRANGRGKQQVFADGEMFVERVLLRNVTDVVFQRVEILIERLPVEKDLSAGGLELASQHSHERAFSRTARAHHANKLTTRDAKRDSLETNPALPKAVRNFVHLECANDIALFLDDSFRKVASQKLADVDSNGISVFERRCSAHHGVTHHDRAIRLDHFQLTDPAIVIAEYLQQHVAARARGEQNIVGFQPARIIRNQIFRFGSLQLEAATQRTCAPAQIAQIHLAVVVEDDPVFQARIDLCAGF